MKRHEFKPDSDWTIMREVNSTFVAIVTFQQAIYREGRGLVSSPVECVAIEGESHSEVLNAGLEVARMDARESTMRVHETWIIREPHRLAGKRDNRRIN